MVFHWPDTSAPAACQFPVQLHPPDAPCSTYGWIDVSGLPAGNHTWNVTVAPGPAPGALTKACWAPAAPLKLTFSAPVPANARSVDCAAPVRGAPPVAQD